MNYNIYSACLLAYCNLEQSNKNPVYVRRYRQFLLQVFSTDNVLQLVPNAAISLLQKYSEGEPPDRRLQPLIPALGMIFLNIDQLNDRSIQMGMPELRQLCGILAQRANVVFHDLIHQREIIMEPLQPPPSPPPRHWETIGCYYGRSPIRHRPYYEGRDSDRSIDDDESRACRKYYSTYTKQTLTGGLMAL